jgi:hypothetical protein
MSKVNATSKLSRFSCIRNNALSKFNQKLISCKAFPEAGSRLSFVTCKNIRYTEVSQQRYFTIIEEVQSKEKAISHAIYDLSI